MTRIIFLVASLTALAACDPGSTYATDTNSTYDSSGY